MNKKQAVILILITMLIVMPLLFSAKFANAATVLRPNPDSMKLHVDRKDIKFSNGAIFVIHATNQASMADYPNGYWMGSYDWNESNVRQELSMMKSWGANTIRLLVNVQDWKENRSYPFGSVGAQTALTRIVVIARELGIYVDVCPYRVTDWYENGNQGSQDALPFPPYSSSANASKVISNIQDYVDYCTSIAKALKNYSNVIFEMWNEPFVDSQQGFNDWKTASNNAYLSMRNAGFSGLIILQWGAGCWGNVDNLSASHSNMNEWVDELKPTSATNVIFSVHAYREWGAYQKNSGRSGYTLQDITNFYTYSGVFNVSRYYPVFIGESGVNLDAGDLENEITAQTNLLDLSIQYGVSIGQWWFDTHTQLEFRMINTDFTPTQGGQVFIDAFTQTPEPLPTAPVAAVIGASAAIIGVGLIVYLRKHRHQN
jgi:hypothetical protein